MRNKKLHTTLLALLLVFLPPYFLVFTDEGNRVTDNAVLWLFGQEDLNLNLKEADTGFTEAHIRQAFSSLEWECGAVQSSFGPYACNAVIGSFNDLPARHVTMFFANDHLKAIQVSYREQYHNALLQHLVDTLGRPENAAPALNATPDADQVLQWNTGKGLVVLKKTIRESEQPALLWLGSAQLNPA